MKCFELIGLIAFALFVSNCFQFEKDRVRCEKAGYEADGCSIHKEVKDFDKKKLKITFK